MLNLLVYAFARIVGIVYVRRKTGNGFVIMLYGCVKNGSLAVLTQSLLLKAGSTESALLNRKIYACNLIRNTFKPALKVEQIFFANLVRCVCGVDFVLLLTQIHRKLIYFIKPNADFKRFLFVAEHQKLLRFFTLFFKRTDSALKFRKNVKQSNEIFLRLLQSSLRISSLMAKA